MEQHKRKNNKLPSEVIKKFPRDEKDVLLQEIDPDLQHELILELERIFNEIDYWSGNEVEKPSTHHLSAKIECYLRYLKSELTGPNRSKNKEATLIRGWISKIKRIASGLQENEFITKDDSLAKEINQESSDDSNKLKFVYDNTYESNNDKTTSTVAKLEAIVKESPEAKIFAELIQIKEAYEESFCNNTLDPQFEETFKATIKEKQQILIDRVDDIEYTFQRIHTILLKKTFKNISDDDQKKIKAIFEISKIFKDRNLFQSHIESLQYQNELIYDGQPYQIALALQVEKSHSYAVSELLEDIGFPNIPSCVRVITEFGYTVGGDVRSVIDFEKIYSINEDNAKTGEKQDVVEKLKFLMREHGIYIDIHRLVKGGGKKSIYEKVSVNSINDSKEVYELDLFINKLLGTLDFYDKREVRLFLKKVNFFLDNTRASAYMGDKTINLGVGVEAGTIIHELTHLRHAAMVEIDPKLISSFFEEIYNTNSEVVKKASSKVDNKSDPYYWGESSDSSPRFGFLHPYALRRYYNTELYGVSEHELTLLEDITTFVTDCFKNYIYNTDPFVSSQYSYDFLNYIGEYRAKLNKIYRHGFFGKRSKEIYDYISSLLDKYEKVDLF